MDFIVYHSADLDGKASGAVLLNHFKNAQTFGYDYGQEFPITKLAGRNLVMADVTVEPEHMFSLAKETYEFVLIDHHVSAFDKIIQYAAENNIETIISELNGLVKCYFFPEFNFRYYYSDVLSACEICQTLYPLKHSFSREKIRLLGQYDTWRNNGKEMVNDYKWNEQVMPFQMASRLFNRVVDVLNSLGEDDINYQITIGNKILEYQKIQSENIVKSKSFTFELNGIRILACNGVASSSQSFDGFYLEEIHDAMMPFSFNGSKWFFSLYTTKDDVDILSIAKSFGGGGHKKACGFSLPLNEVHFSENKIFLGSPFIIDLSNVPDDIDLNDWIENWKNIQLSSKNLFVSNDSYPKGEVTLFKEEEVEQVILPKEEVVVDEVKKEKVVKPRKTSSIANKIKNKSNGKSRTKN